MSPSELIAIGERLYGPLWRSRLAEALGVNVSTVRRWATAATAIPKRTALAIKALEAAPREPEQKRPTQGFV